MELTLSIIESFNLKKKKIRPDWDDAGYEYTLPSGIPVVGFFMLNGEPCETKSLEGLDGYLYIDTKEYLDEIVSLSNDELLNKIKEQNPKFNIDNWM